MKFHYDVCTGCSMCEAICPMSAIHMQTGPHGFFFPEDDDSVCVNCDLCTKKCPLNLPPETSAHTEILAGFALEKDLLESSSSGAVFPLLAAEIIRRGGIVFGAAFDSDFNVVHTYAESVEKLNSMCGSKYVQSRITKSCYEKVRSALDDDRLVYFSGMSCQIAALKNYLGRDYKKLITQDTICHSVPSPIVWNDYMSELEKRYCSKMNSFSFRYKEIGWEKYRIRAGFENGKIFIQSAAENPYQRGFIKGLFSRESCFSCKFRGLERVSDITLADFWGVKNILSEAYNERGTSLIMVHSEKGRELLDDCKDELKLFNVDSDTAFAFNPAAYTAIKKPTRYDEFWKLYRMKPLDKLVERCCKPTVWENIASAVKGSILYRGIRFIIRKFMSIEL